MAYYHSQGRPSSLEISCINCKASIPYSPLSTTTLCRSCEITTEYVRDTSTPSEDGETYVSAAEEIMPTDDEGEDGDSSVTDPGPIGTEHRGEDIDLEGSEAGDGEVEPDLFESTFGGKTSSDTDDEDDKPPPKDRFVADEHSKGCSSIRGPPTPPAKTARSEPASVQATKPILDRCDNPPPDPQKDRSWALRRLERFHLRAKELIPPLPLQPHRYWIGVLSTTKTPENFKVEKDFVWFKGHRKTTVQTIWNFYQQSTATEAFTLLLGHEKVEFKDIMEELDYFADKKVIFRAVTNKHPDAKGRMLTAGIEKMDAEAVKKKVVQPEVIVLYDED